MEPGVIRGLEVGGSASKLVLGLGATVMMQFGRIFGIGKSGRGSWKGKVSGQGGGADGGGGNIEVRGTEDSGADSGGKLSRA